MAPSKTFGQIIRDKRQDMGLSQKDLAARIKKDNGEAISPQYQNDIEFDRRDPPSESIIEQYAKILLLPKESLILAAGRVPSELREFAADNPEGAQQVYHAFRKRQKEK